MPKIKFESDWLKIGNNVYHCDKIKFLDAGTQDDQKRWNFNVEIVPAKGSEAVSETKKFGLNKTNYNHIVKMYGDNSDDWVEKEMQVTKTIVRNPQSGEMVDSILLVDPEVDMTE